MARDEEVWHVPRMSKQADFTRFLQTPELAGLGPAPRAVVESEKTLDEQLKPLLIASNFTPERQKLIRALILLWHDHLDTAHTIAQEIDNADGAFVHGIMHRREPDFGNAAYWFRRVGRHPAFPHIAAAAKGHFEREQALLRRLIADEQWDPFGFIDVCKESRGKPEAVQQPLREVQKLEFECLLNSLEGD